MRAPKGIHNLIKFIILLVFSSYGCSHIDTPTPSPSSTNVVLTHFISSTSENPYINLTASPTENTKNTSKPSPSPTPFRYSVKKGDTFTSIAFFHGVKLNELIAANPDIDPNFLTVGMTITIPVSSTNSIISANPTPIPLKYQEPICYLNQDGGLWCVVEVQNSQPFDIENLSVKFSITSNSLDEEIIKVAHSPINVLPPNLKIPIMVYFEHPIPINYQVQAEIITVIPKSSDTSRYLTPIIQNQDIEISDNLIKATISGEYGILEDQNASRIWIVAVAYSKSGEPVGIRKMDSSTLLPAGEKRSFKIHLYSLGPQISDVKIYIEAQP